MEQEVHDDTVEVYTGRVTVQGQLVMVRVVAWEGKRVSDHSFFDR